MSELPDESERRQLADMRKAGRVHKFILLIFTCALLLGLALPEPRNSLLLFIALLSSALLGISYINMQFFQQCPRCKARLTLAGRQCGRCGMSLRPGP